MEIKNNVHNPCNHLSAAPLHWRHPQFDINMVRQVRLCSNRFSHTIGFRLFGISDVDSSGADSDSHDLIARLNSMRLVEGTNRYRQKYWGRKKSLLRSKHFPYCQVAICFEGHTCPEHKPDDSTRKPVTLSQDLLSPWESSVTQVPGSSISDTVQVTPFNGLSTAQKSAAAIVAKMLIARNCFIALGSLVIVSFFFIPSRTKGYSSLHLKLCLSHCRDKICLRYFSLECI